VAVVRVNSGECAGGQVKMLSLGTALFRAHGWENYRWTDLCGVLHMEQLLEGD
jgi:hypothetical protein